MIEIQNIGYSIHHKWLLQNISYQFLPGKMYMICGPNGAGKSTLMKLLSLQLKPVTGDLAYNGKTVILKHKQLYAKHRAVLSQHIDISFPLSVEELIMMGRYPHFDRVPSKKDFDICEEVMKKLDITIFRKRNYLTLSGGEKQRIQFARVLVQIWETPAEGCRYLLLDEPISSLDLKYQFDFLKQVKDFINDKTIVIAILHDLNLALNYADEILLLDKGNLFCSGKPSDTLHPDNILKVFGVESTLHQFPGTKLLWVNKK